jgi:hypothetical protein
MEGQVRTTNKSQCTRDTHSLLSADRGTSQDNRRRLESKGYLPTVEYRKRDK